MRAQVGVRRVRRYRATCLLDSPVDDREILLQNSHGARIERSAALRKNTLQIGNRCVVPRARRRSELSTGRGLRLTTERRRFAARALGRASFRRAVRALRYERDTIDPPLLR